MSLKLKRIIDDKKTDYIIVGVLCALVFVCIYGVKVLNPVYIDWLMFGGDTSQHYLGWKGYRASSWHFPIGMTDRLAYPNKTSVIFTDSISLMAVAFKVFSPILPKNFQYFGLWGILCFVLQGVLAARIVKNFSDNRIATILAGVLFAFTPIMIWRMYTHSALAGQWVILIGLEPLFFYKKYKDTRRIYIVSAILGLLSSSIHLYFVLLCGIVIVGICIEELLYNKKILRVIAILFSYLLSVVVTVLLLGGFASGMKPDEEGLWVYSFNLNGFLNPQGWSSFLKELPMSTECQYEGFAYLGAGVLFISLIAVLFMVKSRKNIFTKSYLGGVLAILIVFIMSIFVACSPNITLNGSVIFSTHYPKFITDLWSIFRSTGRIVWVAVYIIMIVACVCISRLTGTKTAIVILTLALAVQVYDIYNVLKEKNDFFSTTQEFQTEIATNEFWVAIANDPEIKHIVLFSGGGMNSLIDWALDNGLTMNRFYFARDIEDIVEESRQQALKELPSDTIFIFKRYKKEFCKDYNLHYYEVFGISEIDGVIVGCSKKIDGFEELDESYFLEE